MARSTVSTDLIVLYPLKAKFSLVVYPGGINKHYRIKPVISNDFYRVGGGSGWSKTIAISCPARIFMRLLLPNSFFRKYLYGPCCLFLFCHFRAISHKSTILY
ncbi:MAG: hypothetical protein R2744_06650 [Bacteroidales bacterium]